MSGMGLDTPLWRALTVYRIAALGYALALVVSNFQDYARPAFGWVVVGVMVAWTAAAHGAYADRRRRGWPLLITDFAVGAGCLLASRWVVQPSGVALGSPTLPMAWAAGPVLAWAIAGGRRWGAVAGLLMGAVDAVVRARVSQASLNGVVLMLLAGVVIGHVSRLVTEAAARLERAVELESATRERERLARGIHDSVLQVLALVQRRGTELGGEAAELGRLAGEQEATLRALVAVGGTVGLSGDRVDLRAALEGCAGPAVSLAIPATPVWLPGPVVSEIAAAVGSAMENTRQHAGEGAQVWLLVEDEPGAVTVTVRDNGVGLPPGRLAEAERAGRLGVAQSIRGRLRDLGGEAVITSTPGNGVEVELRIPVPASGRG